MCDESGHMKISFSCLTHVTLLTLAPGIRKERGADTALATNSKRQIAALQSVADSVSSIQSSSYNPYYFHRI